MPPAPALNSHVSTDLGAGQPGIPSAAAGMAIFARVFDDTATSYKLFWFRGILECLKSRWVTGLSTNGPTVLTGQEVVREMLVAAWAPANFFRLSLGQRDTLGRACHQIARTLNVPPNASTATVRQAIGAARFGEFGLETFLQFVPALFQAPWFVEQLRPHKGGRERARQAQRLALNRGRGLNGSPYLIEGVGQDLRIAIDAAWIDFFRSQLGILEAFADHHLADYLQARNPHSPAIIRKLRLPARRDLRVASTFWCLVIARALERGATPVLDIFSGQRLADRFAIDHFLPWSFVAHDQLWNLLPVEKCTNSQKGDSISAHAVPLGSRNRPLVRD